MHEIYTLKNDNIVFSIDESGCVTDLKYNSLDHFNFASGSFFWRIIYSLNEELEKELFPDPSLVRIQQTSPDSLRIFYKNQISDGFLSVTLSCRLENKRLVFDSELNNTANNVVLREFQFPLLKNIALPEKNEMYWSASAGGRFGNLRALLDSCHTQYMAQDDKAVELSQLYPGVCGMNFFLMNDGTRGLYLGSHDPTQQYTLHLFRKRGQEIDVTMVKYPFLNTKESKQINGYVLAPYCGTWRTGADFYRKWAESWWKPGQKPDSVLQMNAWHRLILRHQYGETLFSYHDLPRILQSGLQAGIDTLFLFGWQRAGHDAGYPEYECDPAQGGFPALKEQIAAFRRGGGKLILYFNGQLIDTDTEFYRTTGKKISIKRRNLQEHQEVYPFGGPGTALRRFGNKTFVTACPACREWEMQLKKLIDLAVGLETDGVFFDQLGWISLPCWDPSHGHPVPFMEIMKSKADMIGRLRSYLKSKAPQMSLGIEWFSDLTAQHVDFVHNISGGTHVLNANWAQLEQKPVTDSFMEFTRYTFPEVVLTDRDIRDDSDIERRVNWALLRGFRSDVEIHRCRALIDETPNYQNYLTKANHFRSRNRDLILNGRFLEHQSFSCDSGELYYSVFSTATEYGVLLTQNHKSCVSALISSELDSLEYTGSDCIGEAECKMVSPCSCNVTIKKNAVLLIRFRRLE